MLHEPHYQTLKLEQRERLERAERQRLVLELRRAAGRTWPQRLGRLADRLSVVGGRRRPVAPRPAGSLRA